MDQEVNELFNSDCISIARALLGGRLNRLTEDGLLSGIIVETEAYLSEDDPACHSRNGKTKKNAPMFGPAGKAYIYFIYGKHYCFNVVTGPVGKGEAVLIRALEPLTGLKTMAKNRAQANVHNLAAGPGKLCQALQIDTSLNGHNLIDEPLYITLSGKKDADLNIIETPRIGISRGREKLLRYILAGNRFLSRSDNKRW